MFSGLCKKNLKFGVKLFQTKLLSRLSHNVCCLLSPLVLLRKFTSDGRDDGDGRDNVKESSPFKKTEKIYVNRREFSLYANSFYVGRFCYRSCCGSVLKHPL